MKIHRAYIHSLADLQPRIWYRLPIVGLEPPVPVGAIAACAVVGLVLLAIGLGVLR